MSSAKKYKDDEILSSHISFLYSITKTHSITNTLDAAARVASKSDINENRDDDEVFGSDELEWDTSRDEREPDIEKYRGLHGLVKSLKKPWKRMRRKSDKEPLISSVRSISTQNITDWATIPADRVKNHVVL
mmetsp:Transcript_13568/g.19842  ORF Transcript_13568/g.19842 Transcript_13568/m.19842 type:complete len:132 (+) Transcript_13568:743-1138(+)